MRVKLFFVAITCIVAVNCSTLKLAVNTTAPDGNKLYATSEVTLFASEGDEFFTAMGIKPGGEDSIMAISISTTKPSDNAMFGKGNTMTIGFEDGTEVVLTNILDSYMEVENNVVLKSKPVQGVVYDYYYTPWVGLMYSVPYQVAGYVPSPGVEKTTSSYALYRVSTDQIKAISSKVITKFELQAGKSVFKMKNPKNAGDVYSQLYEFLLENINKK